MTPRRSATGAYPNCCLKQPVHARDVLAIPRRDPHRVVTAAVRRPWPDSVPAAPVGAAVIVVVEVVALCWVLADIGRSERLAMLLSAWRDGRQLARGR